MIRPLAIALAMANLIFLPAKAAASETACGYAFVAWNAPNGAVVFSSGPGPIQDVINAVGEIRTHSVLSHGPGKWASHATMKSPAENAAWPDRCTRPVSSEDLIKGNPGVELVNQGGMYWYYYGDGSLGPTSLTYQVGDAVRAAAIGDYIRWNVSYYADYSTVNTSAVIYRHSLRGGRAPYALFQYRDLEGTATNEPAWNNGMVCSTFLSLAHHASGQGTVTPYVYAHAKIANAANALYSRVKSDCSTSLGFWGTIGVSIICPFFDICGNAANQVTNCMATHACDSSNGVIWQGVRDDPQTTAKSISPDRIGGWSGHPWGSQPGASVWSADYGHAVQWNSPGNVYGCWY